MRGVKWKTQHIFCHEMWTDIVLSKVFLGETVYTVIAVLTRTAAGTGLPRVR